VLGFNVSLAFLAVIHITVGVVVALRMITEQVNHGAPRFFSNEYGSLTSDPQGGEDVDQGTKTEVLFGIGLTTSISA